MSIRPDEITSVLKKAIDGFDVDRPADACLCTSLARSFKAGTFVAGATAAFVADTFAASVITIFASAAGAVAVSVGVDGVDINRLADDCFCTFSLRGFADDSLCIFSPRRVPNVCL